MSRYWRGVTALAAVTALALGGCGRGDGADEGGAQPVGEGKATGDITVWAMGAEGEKLGAFAAEFSKENPDAKVNVTAVPWDAAHQKIVSAIAGKQTPDVTMVGTTWMGEFAKTGALDQTPELIDSSTFFKSAWDSTTVDGRSYGVPWYVETRLLYYRKDLAQQAGLNPPQTWDELKTFAQGMQQRAGAQWGLYLPPGGTGSWQTFLPFAWSNGAAVTKAEAFTINDPAFTEALQYYQSFFTDKLSPADMPAQGGALENGFINGSIGAFFSGPWHIGVLTEQAGAAFADKIGVAAIPRKKSATSFIGGSNLAVFKDSKNRDTAWKFIAWLSRPEIQVKWYQTVKDLPAVQGAWQDPTMSSDALLAAFGKQLQDTKAPPAIITWDQIAAMMDGEIEKVAKSGTDPATATKTMQDKASAIGIGA